MNNLSQTFVKYHGCGYSYLDGTNMLIETGKKCSLATNDPFQRQPIETRNKIAKSTRNQLKTKAKASTNYMKKYFKFVKIFKKINMTMPRLAPIIAQTTNQKTIH